MKYSFIVHLFIFFVCTHAEMFAVVIRYMSVMFLCVCFTCAASAPVYVCVVLGYCSPPVVEDTGPPGAPWET